MNEIEARGLTKHYGRSRAVDQLSFTIRPGQVTGFLGPNGAGKSTTMRMILGLDRPSSGSVTVDGAPFTSIRRPLHRLGAVLEVRAVHGGRSAYHHLLCLAQGNGIPARRVDEVLDLVGLTEVAGRRAGGFSLGMAQRLGLAAALLGDPPILLCDEPVNGLDPEGILWIRTLLRSLAAQGRTVFVSSHLMSEMALTADHLIVIGQGRLIADAPTAEIISSSSVNYVLVRAPEAPRLAEALRASGAGVSSEAGALHVTGLGCEAVGEIAASHRLTLHELSAQNASLEAAFMELTRDSVDFRTEQVAGVTTSTPTSIGYRNLARSEWTKLRSVRSTYWTTFVAVLATVALGALICARMASLINGGKQSTDGFDPTTFSLNGLYLAQVAAGALGVLVISSEYGTGMIRATLSAVPQRLAVLTSKAAVFTAATLLLGEVISFAAFGIGQALLSRAHAGASLTEPGVLRAVVGGGLYLAVVGLLGFGLGALVRHTAGALSAFFGLLFAPSVIIDLLPSSWHNAINYMPANAGSQIFAVQRSSGSLSPWAGFGLFCLYAAVTIAAAAALMTHRDT